MISNELLGKVLEIEVNDIDYSDYIKDTVYFTTHSRGINNEEDNINIYELAHKCKEWAYRSSYDKSPTIESYLNSIDSVHSGNKATACVHFYGVHTDGSTLQKVFNAPTEPEAIFKACEWILQQTNQKEPTSD